MQGVVKYRPKPELTLPDILAASYSPMEAVAWRKREVSASKKKSFKNVECDLRVSTWQLIKLS